MTTISAAPPDAKLDITSSPAVQRNPARHGPVLLAVDAAGSEATAARAAYALALRLNVPLRVVTVVEPWPVYAGAAGLAPMILAPDQESLQAREQDVRRFLTEAIGNEGWKLDVRLGQPSYEIRDLARHLNATAIVMAAQPHGLFNQALAGVRATQVLRGAPCPVLSVTPPFTELPRKVVVAVDFSPASIRAAQAALMFAADDATVALVYVAPASLHARESARAKLGDDVAVLFGRLREHLAPFAPAGVVLQTRELEGEAVQQVLQYADWLGADLVGTGTAGPGLVERMFLGSTAASLVHLARCSVLASPAPRSSEAVDIALHVRGTATMTASKDWPGALDAISRRDAGRRVTMEVDDRDIGAQVEASGYFLRGITFDPHDRRVAIMLESPEGKGAHLTRSIAHVDEIGISANPDGTDRALIVKHGRGQTLLLMSS